MDTRARFGLILALVLLIGLALVAVSRATPAQGGTPALVAYQGEVRVDGAPYNGNGYFKFAIVNGAGDTSFWSNDGTSSNGGAPTANVPLTVSHGLFSVLLGDTSLTGMTQKVTADVFNQPDRYLRVWFSTAGGGPYSQLEPDTAFAAVPYALQARMAVNADRVDGLHASELGVHYQNVVVVAKSGGDYTSVQAAVDSISGATAENPYLVWVAPGLYVEQVTMKAHVHLQGAGQEATVISSTATSGTFPPTAATLKLASDTSLRDLTVGNRGTGAWNVALLATAGTTGTLVADVTARARGGGTHHDAIFLSGSTSVTLQQVTGLAENAPSYNNGLRTQEGAEATLRGGSFTGRGGNYAQGIDNSGVLEADGVTALGENGMYRSCGLYDQGTATLRGGSFTGRGGTLGEGIDNSGTLEAESITALGENSNDNNYGLSNVDTATLRGGSFSARGGAYSEGIHNNEGMVVAENVTALGESGTNSSNGLLNLSGWVTLQGGSFIGCDGTHSFGIYTYGSGATLEADGIFALGEDGITEAYGLYQWSGTADVTQSVLEGATGSVGRVSDSVTVSNSRLVGAAAAGVTCVAVSRGTTFNANGCP